MKSIKIPLLHRKTGKEHIEHDPYGELSAVLLTQFLFLLAILLVYALSAIASPDTSEKRKEKPHPTAVISADEYIFVVV